MDSHEHHHEATENPTSLAARLKSGLFFGFSEIVDRTIPWVLAGLGIAALLETVVDPHMVAEMSGGWQLIVASLVAIPVFVCATGSTPFVALLMHKGLLPGAALAFLLIGPSTNPHTWRALANLHGRKVALAFIACIAAMTLAIGYALNTANPTAFSEPLANLHHKEYGVVAWGSLVVLSAVTLASLLRQGVPGFIARVMSLHGHHHHHHHHHTVSDGCECKH